MSQTIKKKKNGHLNGIFRRVFVCSNQELAPFGTAFLFSPENYQQQNLGTLFGVIKVDDQSPDSSYVVNLLTSVIKKEYFSKTDRSAEESFEAGLRKANLALAELARHGSLNWSGKINFAAGSIEKNTLHFSSLGKACAFLIRSGQIAEISQELEDEKESEPHPLKTFSNISSGKLEKNDKLIFTTSDLLDIFSKEELRHNALHFSTKEFPGLIELSLQANSQLAGAIIVDMTDAIEIDAKPKDIPKIKNGIDLIPAPRREKILPTVPRPALDIREERKNHIFIKSDDELPPKRPFSEKIINFLKKIPAAVQDSLFQISQRILSAKQKIASREKTAPSRTGNISSRVKNVSRGFVLGIKKASGGLPGFIRQRKKAFKIAAFLMIAILLIFFSYRWISSKKAPQEPQVSKNIPAEATLPQIPDDIQIKKIDNIEEVASLPDKTVRFAILNGILYAVPENGKTVLKINSDSKNIEEIKSDKGSGNFKLITAMPHINTLFLLDENNELVSLTPVNKNFQENIIALPDNLKASDIKTFLTYLYVLDPSANQIYRFPRAEGGFGEKQDWLKTDSDVKSAISFAINEDLFAASKDKISVFLQGKEDLAIEFEKPNTALAIDRIHSEPDMENIYVLDNKNHRIVKYSRTGKIVSQYWSDAISGIKDLLVDEKKRAVYLLNGKVISSFQME